MKNLPTPEGEIPKENLLKSTFTVDPLASLPEYVKHPKNYHKIQKALLETLTCGKSHSDPAKMLECTKCAENMRTRREMMHKFGFKDSKMYMAWRKRHEEIIKKLPPEMYDKLINEDKVSV